MFRKFCLACAFAFSLVLVSCQGSPPTVGPTATDSFIIPTQQLVRPAGKSLTFHGRPVDLVLSPEGSTTYVKSNTSILVIDNASWKILQEVKYISGNAGSACGIAVNHAGNKLYVTTAHSHLLELPLGPDKTITATRSINLPSPPKSDMQSYPCSLAISRDDSTAYVCMNALDTLAIVDLPSGKIRSHIATGIAPFGIELSADESVAYVSNWAGRRPHPGDTTTKSYRSQVVVDDQGLPCTGTISVINLATQKEQLQIPVGLHPSALKLSRNGQTLFVANASSDTISTIDTRTNQVTRSINIRPDSNLPFGSIPTAIALSDDEQTLFAALAGNNALAVINLKTESRALNPLLGFIPTAWYPGAVAFHDNHLFIANIKGFGSRDPNSPKKWNSKDQLGCVNTVQIPTQEKLAQYTKQVLADSLVPQSLRAFEKSRAKQPPVPVPEHIGDPALIDHVIYIIKENRTYDQVFGDIGKGNSDPKLCIYGRNISPNHHALADQFVLLDNFYCNGVLSPDGHAWATQGLTIDYLEREAGAYVRSYPFGGEDAMAISPTGFIWTNALLHGLTFRNYGEMVHTQCTVPTAELHKLTTRPSIPPVTNSVGPLALAPYTHPQYPGWNLRIPDSVRLKIFLDEFEKFKSKNELPNLIVLWLPSDHTRGITPDAPTPQAMIADNDLALGKIVEAVSHSQFWKSTCIFVAEDDPQNGFDHVDGHRSLCLVASPYTKRHQVISNFYNQGSILHTMERMLGLPPMNQLDAMAPLMTNCFTSKADLTPYDAVPNNIPLDQLTQRTAKPTPPQEKAFELNSRLDFDEPDQANEDILNRLLWYAARGNEAYPAEFAGAHGRGLKALHLVGSKVKDDDD